MTHVFDMQLHKIQIGADYPEWEARFPYVGEAGKKTGEIVDAWRSGLRKNTPDEMPKELIVRKPRKTWPDAFETLNGLLVVSGAAKDVIERLDPGLHQFFPLSIRTKRGVVIEGPWFAMNVTERQNSIVIEQSRVLVNKRAPDRLCSFLWDFKHVTVDPSKLSGIHFWREARFRGSLLGSDALLKELKDAGVKFFSSFKAKEFNKDLEA
ncbi:MAG: DUF1629 domain-containing protein [Pseudomonadota bacterium]